MPCITPGIPEHLHRNGRQPDQDFTSDNILYIRVNRKYFEQADVLGKVSINAFTSDRQSSNRDKFSESIDVLYNIDAGSVDAHFFDWGIVSLGLAELSTKTFDHVELNFSFRVHPFHQPEECMYPHSELVLKKVNDGEEVQINARLLKTAIRAHYRDVSTIVKHPDED